MKKIVITTDEVIVASRNPPLHSRATSRTPQSARGTTPAYYSQCQRAWNGRAV